MKAKRKRERSKLVTRLREIAESGVEELGPGAFISDDGGAGSGNDTTGWIRVETPVGHLSSIADMIEAINREQRTLINTMNDALAAIGLPEKAASALAPPDPANSLARIGSAFETSRENMRALASINERLASLV